MNKYDIYQLHVEVHGVEVYPLCYRLVSGRLVGSKKSPVALSDPVSTNVRCFAGGKVCTNLQSQKRWIRVSVFRTQKLNRSE